MVLITLVLQLFLTYGLEGQRSDSGSKEKVTISGSVVSAIGNPVAGARIYVDSLYTGKITDTGGRYKIKVDKAAKRILASSRDFGFCAEEIKGRISVDLTLNGDLSGMNSFLSRNINNYKPEKEVKAKKINTYTDIYQMIRQEVPGVVVSGKSIVVQQQNSFFGSSSPLFVVNGVRVTSIDYINPLDVKSIQLLKGSSANIYGNDGANGVISITLLSGKEK